MYDIAVPIMDIAQPMVDKFISKYNYCLHKYLVEDKTLFVYLYSYLSIWTKLLWD